MVQRNLLLGTREHCPMVLFCTIKWTSGDISTMISVWDKRPYILHRIMQRDDYKARKLGDKQKFKFFGLAGRGTLGSRGAGSRAYSCSSVAVGFLLANSRGPGLSTRKSCSLAGWRLLLWIHESSTAVFSMRAHCWFIQWHISLLFLLPLKILFAFFFFTVTAQVGLADFFSHCHSDFLTIF